LIISVYCGGYRNRRIRDFLKELDLTEGRGTGFPTIYKVMERNGSPKPIFETDDQNVYFLAILPKRVDEFTNRATNVVNDSNINNLGDFIKYINTFTNPATNVVKKQYLKILDNELHNKVIDLLLLLVNKPMSKPEILEKLGLSNQTFNRRKYIDPLVELNWIEKRFPDKTSSPKQVYKITNLGATILEIFEK